MLNDEESSSDWVVITWGLSGSISLMYSKLDVEIISSKLRGFGMALYEWSVLDSFWDSSMASFIILFMRRLDAMVLLRKNYKMLAHRYKYINIEYIYLILNYLIQNVFYMI